MGKEITEAAWQMNTVRDCTRVQAVWYSVGNTQMKTCTVQGAYDMRRVKQACIQYGSCRSQLRDNQKGGITIREKLFGALNTFSGKIEPFRMINGRKKI